MSSRSYQMDRFLDQNKREDHWTQENRLSGSEDPDKGKDSKNRDSKGKDSKEQKPPKSKTESSDKRSSRR
jgi:hypothetical protein